MIPRILPLVLGFAVLFGNPPLGAQTPPTNTHYVSLSIKMTLDPQQNPKEFSLYHASSEYGEIPESTESFFDQGYILEFVTESGDKFHSSFDLSSNPYSGEVVPHISASIPNQQNGIGYRIYKDGVLIWTENILSPTGDLPIKVEDLGGGKLRILPESVDTLHISEDGGLHWEMQVRPELTSDWVYQISKYDPLKLPKPLIRIDVWHKLRRQSFTYEVGATPAQPVP